MSDLVTATNPSMAQQNDTNDGSQLQRFSCDFCTDTFAFRSGLSRHVAKKHKDDLEDSEEGNIFCDLCSEISRYVIHSLHNHQIANNVKSSVYLNHNF